MRNAKMIVRFILVLTVIFSTLLLRCEGYAFLQPYYYGEGECIDDDWVSHPLGSIWYDTEKCEKLECIFYEGIMYGRGYGCHTIGVPSGCKLVAGRGSQYPHCCPEVKCPNGVRW